ncbi:hypothetical protein GCM10027053_30860 [Intrasporangium mesophilum]
MRTIMRFTVAADDGVDVSDRVTQSLAEYGWVSPSLSVERNDLVTIATNVIDAASRANRDLPVSPDSQYIQAAIDRHFNLNVSKNAPATGQQPGTNRFAPNTFERNCLEQAILILTQIKDENDRREAFQREMKIFVGPEFETYGIVFLGVYGADPVGQSAFQSRLRCNDLNRLQSASVSFVSAMNPSKTSTRGLRHTSPAASVGRRKGRSTPFDTTFTRVEIRSVANEHLFTGRVVPIRGRLSLLRQTLADRSAKVLGALSLSLIAASAALFAFAPDQGWWMWTEQLTGRLATGAFGALLVDGAMDYSALRRALMAGSGAVTHGAIIDWKRHDG